jgi:hypothetical protein
MEVQSDGICERFHKSILRVFYQIAFRKKLNTDLECLQVIWMSGGCTVMNSERVRERCAVAGRSWQSA